MSCFLGIDAGTSGVKALVIDTKGNILGSGYEECDVSMPKPGYAEQDPKDWWKALDIAVIKAVKESNKGGDIKAIGFSGQMQGTVLVDKDGELVDNCIIWMDQRANAEVEYIEKIIPVSECIEITANHCVNSYSLPKLLWTKENRPEVFEKTAKVLFPKDYLRFLLTGEYAAEVSDSSQTFLFDVPNRCWSKSMFDRIGLSQDLVPEKMLESGDVAGYLKPELAKRWGLTPNIPVAAGGADQAVSGVGTGIVRPGIFGSSIGTSGVVYGCLDKPLIDPNTRATYSLCHSVKDLWGFCGLSLTAGASLKWLRDNIFADRKAVCAKEGINIYDYITSLAEKAQAGSEGLCFLPYLNGDKTPNNDENARATLFGLSYRHGLPEICRSFMEGVTFSLRETVEICREFGMEVNEIRATGGGARSQLWKQMQADIYNANVATTNVEEAPAFGAAILAATAVGEFATVEQGCDAIVKVTGVVEPNKENVKIYDEYFATYKALYGALKEQYAKQAEIVKKNEIK